MAARFSIVVVPSLNLLKIEMAGFFAAADIERFVADLKSKLGALRCAPNEHLTLCDISEMNIQAQESVSMFSNVVGHPDLLSRRLAFVATSSLARSQARRLTDRSGISFFTNIKDAQAWLLASSD